MRALSLHTLLEFYGCDAEQLKHTRQVKALLHKSVVRGGGTIVKEMFHNFNPYGVSGVIVITESHVTIHTWPEYGYAAVDIFSCSGKLDHAAIRDAMERGLYATRVESKSFSRGPHMRKSGLVKISAGRAGKRARRPKKS